MELRFSARTLALSPDWHHVSGEAALCTIIVANHAHPAFPVVIAANRDEFYARSSTVPLVLAESPRIVGGRDGVKGGTWMAVNERGLFVGLTNQRTWYPANPALRSRGEVVMAALEQVSPRAMVEVLERVDASAYNPFNLVFGDARELFVAYFRNEPASVTVEPLPHGVHVLPNDVLDSREFPKVERARSLVAPALSDSFDALRSAMKRALSDHTKLPMSELAIPPPDAMFPTEMVRELSALCIHTDVYGTRSASFIALDPGRVAHYEFASGPSCEHPFESVLPIVYEPAVT